MYMNEMKSGIKIFYMCGVTWQHELGETRVLIYTSLEQLREKEGCGDSCGIVKVTCEPEWIVEQNLLGERGENG